MKKAYFLVLCCVAATVLIWCAVIASVAHADIGNEADVSKVLGVSVNDIHRMEVALGRHQSLHFNDGTPRPATLDETVKEMVGRMNEIVIRYEENTRKAAVEAQMEPIKAIEAK